MCLYVVENQCYISVLKLRKVLFVSNVCVTFAFGIPIQALTRHGLGNGARIVLSIRSVSARQKFKKQRKYDKE